MIFPRSGFRRAGCSHSSDQVVRRARLRRLAAEPLEERVMLSITPTSTEPPIQQIVWNGHAVDAFAGRWIVSVADSAITTLANATSGGSGASLDLAALRATGGLSSVAMHAVDNWLSNHGASGALKVLRTLGESGNEQLLQLESAVTTQFPQLQAALSQLPGFRYIEPDFVLSTTATTPNDPLYSTLYGLNNTGQTGGVNDADIDAPEAWDLTTGSSSIVVGVIDTGVDYTHPDLAANIWTNPGEIAGDGIDNDNNGYIDDIHGWDFVNDDNDPMDDNDHGTHVSGTIGAKGNNGVGVVGVNWNVQIMALKYLGATGHGSTSNAVDALNYATMMRRDHGINIRLTSNSWGGGGYSQSLYDAIAASRDQDMLFIAAAGNGDPDGIGDDNDAVPFYPATYDLDNIISVAATDSSDHKAGFSNFGSSTVDLGAPGVSVRSTIPGNTYANFNGTSMATPHVAGVAALAWSIAPSASYTTIKDAILGGVDPIPALDGITVTGGRLNAYGTLQQLGMRVVSSTPANNSVVTSLPTDFAVNFSYPYLASSIAASDLLVNGIAADSFTLTDGDTVTFHYNATPVVNQGLQSVALADGAVLRASDSSTLFAYAGSFRYDVLPLAVVSSVPASGSTATLPMTSLQFTFNEAFDASTVSIDDVTLNQGTVTGFNILGQTVTYLVAGLKSEGTLNFSFKAGALADVYGNPLVAYSGSSTLDFGIFPFATPLEPIAPDGTLTYDPGMTGSIGTAGDVDTFTIYLLAGQVLTAVADPAAGLRPTIEVRSPSSSLLSTSTAAAAGQDAVVQTVTAATSGTYTVALSGNASTTGAYTVKLYLNAAAEQELHNGSSNNTQGAAQNINAAFVAAGVSGPTVASVIGQTDDPLNPALPAEIESNGTTATANNAIYNFFSYSSNPSLYQLAISGTIAASDSDWFKIGAMQTSDVITISLSGSPGTRGTLATPLVELYRNNSGSPVLVTSDDDSGPGADALIYRFTIPAADTYFIRARPTTTGTGTYQLAAWLENGGAAPTTGGSFTAEAESNNSAATANDASTSWRAVGYRSHTTGTITTSDTDLYKFTLSAGDVITIMADSTSTMDARVALLNSAGTVIAQEDGNSVGPGVDSPIYGYRIATSGTYYVRVQARTGTGAYNADVYLSAATAPPVSASNPDWYAFDLTAGQRVSLVLKGLEAGNVDVTLVNPAGVDVVAGSAGSTNADEMIHQYVAPTTGTYYARINGVPNVDYHLSVVRDAEFDTEGNDSPSGSLVDLTQVRHALGFLDLNRPVTNAPVTLTLDSTQSVVTIAGDLADLPFLEQQPGSLVTHYQGTLVATILPGSIQFSGGSVVDAIAHAGPFLPGNVSADYAGQVTINPSFIVTGIFRNLIIDALSGTLPVDGNGNFDASKLSVEISTGDLVYNIPGSGDGTYALDGVIADNAPASAATIQEVGGVLYLTIPVDGSDSIIEPSSGLQFNLHLTGQLVASLVLPPPIDPDDYYQVTLAAGESVTVSTETPLDTASAARLNTLDPSLQLLDASNALVASDANSATDGRNAVLHFTSVSGGTYKIHVHSDAGKGEYVLNTLITPPNQAPVLDAIGNQIVTAGNTLTLTAHATDPDLNSLTYSLAPGAPDGATINATTGEFSWTPSTNVGSPFSVTIIVTDNGSPQLSDSETIQVQVDPAAPPTGPQVINVLVNGTSWSAGFRSALQTANLGDGTGYAIPVGSSAQATPLPWSTINQIEIVFSADVIVQQSSLALAGINVVNYASSDFTYSPGSHTAKWTFSTPLDKDRLVLNLSASGPSAITDTTFHALDGDWQNQLQAYPSGNGAAGGDFTFAFNVLSGDVHADGVVNAQDIAAVASNWLHVNGLTGDANGDGIVNAQDISITASHWLSVLPPAGGGGSGNSLIDNENAVISLADRAPATSSLSAAATASPAALSVVQSVSGAAAQAALTIRPVEGERTAAHLGRAHLAEIARAADDFISHLGDDVRSELEAWSQSPQGRRARSFIAHAADVLANGLDDDLLDTLVAGRPRGKAR